MKKKNDFDGGSKILLRLDAKECEKLDEIIQTFANDLECKGLRIHYISRAQMVRTIVLTYFDADEVEKARKEEGGEK